MPGPVDVGRVGWRFAVLAGARSETQRGIETLRVLRVCLNFLTVLPPH